MITSLPPGTDHRLHDPLRLVRDACAWLKDTSVRAWRWHREHMTANPSYRAAVATAAAGIVSQLTLDRLLEAMVTALIGLYVAAHREPRHGYDGGDRWDSRWESEDRDLYPWQD